MFQPRYKRGLKIEGLKNFEAKILLYDSRLDHSTLIQLLSGPRAYFSIKTPFFVSLLRATV